MGRDSVDLTDILVWETQATAEGLYQGCIRRYQVNLADALSEMKGNLVRLFEDLELPDLLGQLLRAMTLSVEVVRLDRSSPCRIKPNRNQGFYRNYKRTRRGLWASGTQSEDLSQGGYLGQSPSQSRA